MRTNKLLCVQIMNIEQWEILQFFDKGITLPDMSYGQWAFSLEIKDVKIELYLNLVVKTAQLSINTSIKQFIKVNEIEKIESTFEEFLIIKKSGKKFKLSKKSDFTCSMEV